MESDAFASSVGHGLAESIFKPPRIHRRHGARRWKPITGTSGLAALLARMAARGRAGNLLGSTGGTEARHSACKRSQGPR